MARMASIGELEAKLDEAVAAIHRASESLERHVEVLGALSESLPPLTASVTRLTDELGHAMAVTAPIAAAEREASRLDRLLRRRPQGPSPSAPVPEPVDPEAEAPADG